MGQHHRVSAWWAAETAGLRVTDRARLAAEAAGALAVSAAVCGFAVWAATVWEPLRIAAGQP